MRLATLALLAVVLAGPARAFVEAEAFERTVAYLAADEDCTEATTLPGWERRSVVNPDDGYRVRYSRFGCEAGRHGAILLLPGRGEPAYEYAETALDFIARGYGPVYAVDHRGQGLSPRLLADPHKGHVARFEDYVEDLEAVVGAVLADLETLGAGAEPILHLTSNSMGGAVAIGYLQRAGEEAPFRSAALLGAMIHVNYHGFTGTERTWWNLRLYSETGALLQARWRCGVATLWHRDRCEDYALEGPGARYREGSRNFRHDDEAVMTQSAARHAVRTHMWDVFDWSGIAAAEYVPGERWEGPQLGGATNGWVLEGARFTREMRREENLARMVHVPVLLLTGTRDLRAYRPYPGHRRPPDLSRHREFCETLNAVARAATGRPVCTFRAIEGAFHELYKEADRHRDRALDAVDGFFRAQAG